MAQRQNGTTNKVQSRNEAAPAASDFNVESLLAENFNVADYLNQTFPPLHISDSSTTASELAALADLSAKTQLLTQQLNAQSSRLSTTLTRLTDEILRSGGRLAYEVEILKGDAATLAESLKDGLEAPIAKIVPSGLSSVNDEGDGEDGVQSRGNDRPEYISNLRMLTLARERLQSVINVFGEAMEWVLPPSEYSTTSSFISVSAPESEASNKDLEEKGQAYAKRARDEITALAEAAEDVDGLEAAYARVEALHDLAQLWKGTTEEKPRVKFVDSLTKIVEDREIELEEQQQPKEEAEDKLEENKRSRSQSVRQKSDMRYGFLENFQRMKEGFYLE